MVAQFFKNLIQGEPLTVYGDGEQTRDFLYVDDLVDSVLLADKADVHAEVFQVASGRETSIRDLISAMKKSVPEFKAEIRCEPARAGEISRNCADIGKPARCLGTIQKRGWKMACGIPGTDFCHGKAPLPPRAAFEMCVPSRSLNYKSRPGLIRIPQPLKLLKKMALSRRVRTVPERKAKRSSSQQTRFARSG